jgi:acylglycerol lipase
MEIFVKSWVPANNRPKGLIFLCHGYGDTVTFFFEGLARALAVAGYAVHGMDYPGFGLSDGLHGYVPDFGQLVEDVMEQYKAIKERPENKGLPCFLFGESMGGAVALKAHLKDSSMWDGAVLVAPMCKIAEAMYPPWYLVQIMIALAHVIPKAKLVPHTDIAAIGFRDEEKRHRASYNPVAYIGNPRLGTALQLLQTTDYIESKLHEVSLPLLVLHGAADQVTDPSISKLLHERAKSEDKTIHLYDEAWHCLLQGEPDDVVKHVMKDIITWFDAHAASKANFEQSSEVEMEERVASAAPNLIDFGKFDAVKELL